jgi:hypothetical protein
MEADLEHRLAVRAGRDPQLREGVGRVERELAKSVAAAVQRLDDVARLADAISVSSVAAQVPERARVDVGDDGLPLRRRHGDEVDRARERLRSEEDVATALHHFDRAIALDDRRVIHVRLGVRIDRHRHAVLEDEDAPAPPALETADADVDAVAAAVLLTDLHAGHAAQHLGRVDGLRALEIFLADDRAGPRHLLQRIGAIADHAHLYGRLALFFLLFFVLLVVVLRLRSDDRRSARFGIGVLRERGLRHEQERENDEPTPHGGLQTPFPLHPVEGAGQSLVPVHVFAHSLRVSPYSKHTPLSHCDASVHGSNSASFDASTPASRGPASTPGMVPLQTHTP